MEKRRRIIVDDRITAMPIHLIECILEHLSPLDAARFCILSRDWHNLWYRNQNLIFDKSFTDVLFKNKNYEKHIFDAVVTDILSSHIGPIHKFVLYLPIFNISNLASHIDNWMLILSRNHIRKLCIENSNTRPSYELPTFIINSPELTHLHLSRCLLKPSPALKFSNKLVSIHLENMEFSQELALLLPSIESLRALAFVDCRGMENLTIQVPNLTSFCLVHCPGFNWRFFETNKSPGCVIIKQAVSRIHPSCLQGRTFNSFDNFCNTEDLRLNGSSLKILAACGFPESLPSVYDHILKLCLREFRWYRFDNFSSAVGLIRSSPNLKYLEMNVAGAKSEVAEPAEVASLLENTTFMERGKVLQKLQTVKIDGLNGSKGEALFIKLVLSHSPKLQSIKLGFRKDMDRDTMIKVLAELNRFSRASAVAEVLYDVKDSMISSDAEAEQDLDTRRTFLFDRFTHE